MRRALVLGGTGTVGREVLRGLAAAGIPTVFTFHHARELGERLAAELSQRAAMLDLADPAAIVALVEDLARRGESPDVLIHCAAVLGPRRLEETPDADWDRVLAVNARSAFVTCRELAPRLASVGGGDVVLVGALDRGQSLPLPPAFAASQGLLGALAMALAKELGPRGIRVNLVALGPLGAGLSAGLDAKLLEDYVSFSALRRLGTAQEAARAILWLALENAYVNGKVVPVNGGL